LNWSIGKKLAGGFSACVGLLVLFAVYTLYQLSVLTQLQDAGADRAKDAQVTVEVSNIGV
jgi:CHASE3 domain sensor protein